MSLLSFAAVVHARPKQLTAGPTLRLRGLDLPTLQVLPTDAEQGFGRSFEEFAAAVERFERMFFEPDGSFVWTASPGEPRWQLDGLVHDRGGRVVHVELKGTCPEPMLDRLLAALGSDSVSVMFQLVREAVFFDHATFRRFAAAPPTMSE